MKRQTFKCRLSSSQTRLRGWESDPFPPSAPQINILYLRRGPPLAWPGWQQKNIKVKVDWHDSQEASSRKVKYYTIHTALLLNSACCLIERGTALVLSSTGGAERVCQRIFCDNIQDSRGGIANVKTRRKKTFKVQGLPSVETEAFAGVQQ